MIKSSDIRQQFVKLGGLALWAELVGVGDVGLEAFDLLAESASNKNLDLSWDRLNQTRPTAINLKSALDRCRNHCNKHLLQNHQRSYFHQCP